MVDRKVWIGAGVIGLLLLLGIAIRGDCVQ